LRGIAGRHGVDLLAAALQFSLAPDVASALIVGTANPAHILADHAAHQAKIPPDFWDDLRSTGMLHPDPARAN
jgi:D-threo-aldose 1-dehydrogenase